MRDSSFSVTSVTDSDVIHASRNDIPRIFRVTTSQIHLPISGLMAQTQSPSQNSQEGTTVISQHYTLLMADTPQI